MHREYSELQKLRKIQYERIDLMMRIQDSYPIPVIVNFSDRLKDCINTEMNIEKTRDGI